MSLLESYSRIHNQQQPIKSQETPTEQAQETSIEQKPSSILSQSYESIQKIPESERQQVPEEETNIGKATRLTAGTAYRGLSFPLDVLDTIKSTLGPKLSEEDLNKLKENLSKAGPMDIAPTLPTKPYKERIKEATGGYLEPKTEGEKDWYEFVEDAVPLAALHANTELNALGRMGRAAAISGIGKGAEKYAKYSGAPEDIQKSVKTGMEFVASLINPRMAARHATDLYNQSERLLPRGIFGSQQNLNQMDRALERLEQDLQSGHLAESERAVLQDVQIARQKIADGTLDVRSAMNSIRSINEKSQNFLYSTQSRLSQARARQLWPEVQDRYRNYIDTARGQHPEAIDLWERANEAWGAIAGSRRAGNFIRGIVKEHPATAAVAAMLGFQNTATLLPIVGKAAVAAPLYPVVQIVHRAIRSPELANLYFRAVRQAIGENSVGFLKTMNQLKEKIESNPTLKKYLKEQEIRSEYSGSHA